jgi:hypothetical protein
MFQFLANVDPVSVPMWAVLLLSFAMYPLGFLFGACSDCCDECPDECSRCNRAHSGSGEGQCRDISGNFELRIVGGNTVSGTFYNGFSNQNISSLVLPFTCEESSFEGFGPPVVWSFRLEIEPRDAFPLRSLSDECNCISCCDLHPRVRIRLWHISGILSGIDRNFAPETSTLYSFLGDATNSISMALCECSEDGVANTMSLQAYANLMPDRYSSGCRGLLAEWISEQSLELVISDVDPCECGACCINGTCDSNQTEYYCEDNGVWFDEKFRRAGVWQGVGTDCDPNPCPQPGACCDGGECSQTLEENCGGVFQGEGTTCDPNPCEE